MTVSAERSQRLPQNKNYADVISYNDINLVIMDENEIKYNKMIKLKGK